MAKSFKGLMSSEQREKRIKNCTSRPRTKVIDNFDHVVINLRNVRNIQDLQETYINV